MENTDQVEIPAPDANAAPETEVEEGSEAESSPAVNDTDEIAAKAKGVGKRIDELTRNWREEQRAREASDREREYWRDLALKQTAQPKPPDPPVEALKTEADFDFDTAKYQAYLIGEARKGAVDAAKQELQAERDRQAKAQRETSFATRSQEFAKTVEDFDDVVRNPSLRISDAMADVIKESDDGPALAYHLGKNPDVADKIAQLPPIAAARELGKIEAKLAFAREQAKEKPVSKAPPPPPKVEGTNPTTSVKPDSAESDKALSDAEWARLRNKQLSRRR